MKLKKPYLQYLTNRSRNLIAVCSVVLLLNGCGIDSDDGDVTNTIDLPTDSALDLYCENMGVGYETCVLDDPENPYANVAFVTADPSDNQPDNNTEFNDVKFALAAAAPSTKALFYLWATTLVRQPNGENQLNTARALYLLSDESGSQLIRDQALAAYRSVLDNFLGHVTFFSTADFGVTPGVFYPLQVSELAVAQIMVGVGGTLMFDDADLVRNGFLARVEINKWGYFWDEHSGEVTPF